MFSRIISKSGLGQNSLFLTTNRNENKVKYQWCSLKTGELYNNIFDTELEALKILSNNDDLLVEFYDEYTMTYDIRKAKNINDFYPNINNPNEQ